MEDISRTQKLENTLEETKKKLKVKKKNLKEKLKDLLFKQEKEFIDNLIEHILLKGRFATKRKEDTDNTTKKDEEILNKIILEVVGKMGSFSELQIFLSLIETITETETKLKNIEDIKDS